MLNLYVPPSRALKIDSRADSTIQMMLCIVDLRYECGPPSVFYGGPVGRALRHLRDALIEVCTAHFLRFALAPRTNLWHGCLLSLNAWKESPTPQNIEMVA